MVTDSAIMLSMDEGISTLQLDNDSDTNGEVRVAFSFGSAKTWANWFTKNILFIPPFNDMNTYSYGNTTVSSAGGSMYDRVTFVMEDGTRLLKKGQGATFTLGNLYSFIEYNGVRVDTDSVWEGIGYFDTSKITRTEITYISTDGTQIKEYSPTVSYTSNGDRFTITFEATPQEFDVKEIRVLYVYDIYTAYQLPSDNFEDIKYPDGTNLKWVNNTRRLGFTNGTLSINVDDESVGLIGGIIEWVKGIYNATIGLPAQIGQWIADKLIALFTPDQEEITTLREEWDSLLADRFGLVYESGTIITGIFNEIIVIPEQDTINIPEVTIELSGEQFTFGGYDVDIVPDGFEFLQITVKTIIDICVSLLFLNAMRKTYDRLFGG